MENKKRTQDAEGSLELVRQANLAHLTREHFALSHLDELNQLVDEELTDVSITPGQMFYDTSKGLQSIFVDGVGTPRQKLSKALTAEDLVDLLSWNRDLSLRVLEDTGRRVLAHG